MIGFADTSLDIRDEDGVGGELEESFVLLLAGELALLGENSVGGFGRDDESAADVPGGVANGAVAVGPVDIFELSVTEDRDKVILMPG